MTLEQIEARKTQWSDVISKITQGIEQWDANTQTARQILTSPQLKEMLANITDEDISTMGTHAKYSVQKLYDAYYASIFQQAFLNLTLGQAEQLGLFAIPDGVNITLDMQIGDALRWMKP